MKKSLSILLKLAVMAGLLAFLYSKIDFTVFRASLASFRLAFLPLVFALLFANTVLNSWKWNLLLRADGIPMPLRSLVVSHLIATFFNLFLPSSIGGDAYRIVDVGRRTRAGAKSFAAVFAERLAGFLALAVWGLLFAAAGYRHLANPRLLLLPVLVFLLMGILVAFVVQQRALLYLWGLFRLDRLGKLDAFLRRFLASIARYRSDRPLLCKVFALSLLFQMIVIVTIYSLSRALHWTVPFPLFCVFVPLITLGEALPISIFGIGIRDSLYVFFFARPELGVSSEQALAFAAVYVAVSVTYSLLGGLLFLLRPAPPPAPPAPPA